MSWLWGGGPKRFVAVWVTWAIVVGVCAVLTGRGSDTAYIAGIVLAFMPVLVVCSYILQDDR